MNLKGAILICLLSSFLLLGFCLQTVTAENWQQVTTFTGSGTQNFNTDLFQVNGTYWRISWTYAAGDYPSMTGLSFFVYANGNDNPVGDFIDTAYSHPSGTMSLKGGPGLFYLNIQCANTQSYTITVESNEDTANSSSPVPAITAGIILIVVAVLIVVIIFTRRRHKQPRPDLNLPIPPPPPPPA